MLNEVQEVAPWRLGPSTAPSLVVNSAACSELAALVLAFAPGRAGVFGTRQQLWPANSVRFEPKLSPQRASESLMAHLCIEVDRLPLPQWWRKDIERGTVLSSFVKWASAGVRPKDVLPPYQAHGSHLVRLSDLWTIACAASRAGGHLDDVAVLRALADLEDALSPWATPEELATVRRKALAFVVDVLVPLANSAVTVRVVGVEDVLDAQVATRALQMAEVLAREAGARADADGAGDVGPGVQAAARALVGPVAPGRPGRFADLEID